MALVAGLPISLDAVRVFLAPSLGLGYVARPTDVGQAFGVVPILSELAPRFSLVARRAEFVLFEKVGRDAALATSPLRHFLLGERTTWRRGRVAGYPLLGARFRQVPARAPRDTHTLDL